MSKDGRNNNAKANKGDDVRNWQNRFQYALFPVAGMVYGTVPAVIALLCHFWTLELKYRVSVKPKSSSDEERGRGRGKGRVVIGCEAV